MSEKLYGLGDDSDNMLVQKSKPLTALWQSDLTLGEFKILDAFLARIDSHVPEKRAVIFTKKELENLFGVVKLKPHVLEERLTHLMGHVVKITDEDERDGFRAITLFEEAVAKKNDSGVWTISLECTQKAMKYFFNIDNIGYFKYKLKTVLSLKSRSAYIMYMYLEDNKYRGSFEIDVNDLKKMLGLQDKEAYKEYYRFNELVLNKIHEEITTKTDCRYSYKGIRSGGTTKTIRFTIEKFPKIFDEITDDKNILNNSVIHNELWINALSDDENVCEFSSEELEELRSILLTIPANHLPESIDASTDDIEFKRYHLMRKLYATLNRMCAVKDIKNRYAYLKKLLSAEL